MQGRGHGNEHQASGNKWEKLTIALNYCCLFLLYATVVITATRAHVDLSFNLSPCKIFEVLMFVTETL